jgi:hypothetical protein
LILLYLQIAFLLIMIVVLFQFSRKFEFVTLCKNYTKLELCYADKDPKRIAELARNELRFQKERIKREQEANKQKQLPGAEMFAHLKINKFKPTNE